MNSPLTTPMTKEQLTDECPDDEFLEMQIILCRKTVDRYAKEGRMKQSAVQTLILNALLELKEYRNAAMNAEPDGYHVIKENGQVCCSVATLEEARSTRDLWNKRWTIKPYFYTAPSALPAAVVNAGPVADVLKEHQLSNLITELGDIAIAYRGTPYLRERIACAVRTFWMSLPVATHEEDKCE